MRVLRISQKSKIVNTNYRVFVLLFGVVGWWCDLKVWFASQKGTLLLIFWCLVWLVVLKLGYI